MKMKNSKNIIFKMSENQFQKRRKNYKKWKHNLVLRKKKKLMKIIKKKNKKNKKKIFIN